MKLHFIGFFPEFKYVLLLGSYCLAIAFYKASAYNAFTLGNGSGPG